MREGLQRDTSGINKESQLKLLHLKWNSINEFMLIYSMT